MPQKFKKSYKKTKAVKKGYKKTRKMRKYSRMRKYHKKYYKRKAFKKAGSSIYKVKGQQGLKWSRYLSLTDFLTFPNIDIFREIASMVLEPTGGDAGSTYYGLERKWNTRARDQAKKIISDYFRVYSTKVFDQSLAAGKDWNMLKQPKWKAWNPPLWPASCGSLFNTYINMYRQFKYVGVKVKWIPSIKNVNMNHVNSYVMSMDQAGVTAIPDPVSITTADHLSAGIGTAGDYLQIPVKYPSLYTGEMHPYNPLTFKSVFGIETPYSDNTYYVNEYDMFSHTRAPPMYRLWINFNQQGYESTDDVYVDMTTATPTDTTKIVDNRIKYSNLYKNGVFNTNNFSKIKSYPLNKSFKFYIRPHLTQRMFENNENETTLNNAELGATATQQGWRTGNEQVTEFVTSPKKFPWLQCMQTYPYNQDWAMSDPPMPSGKEDQTYRDGVACIFDDKMYTNPIMFGWMLTNDNIDFSKSQDIFTPNAQGGRNFTTSLYMCDLGWSSLPYINSLGKFKVTFYVRFKGAKTSLPNISFTDALVNATGGTDMETEQ